MSRGVMLRVWLVESTEQHLQLLKPPHAALPLTPPRPMLQVCLVDPSKPRLPLLKLHGAALPLTQPGLMRSGLQPLLISPGAALLVMPLLVGMATDLP
jgi:hypothetical protein